MVSKADIDLSASDAILKIVDAYRLQIRGIVHVGASFGQEVGAYKHLGVGPVVYVEPIPVVFEVLNEVVSKLKGHKALNSLCSDETGSIVEFNVSSNGGLSSSIFPLGRHEDLYPEIEYTEKLRIQSFRLDDLLTSYDFEPRHFSYMNIDVQGAEMRVLAGAPQVLKSLDALQLEVSPTPLYEGGCTLLEIKSFLESIGFHEELVQINPNNWGEALFLRSKDR